MIELPKVSIITPSFNQSQFIEQTILSVINQDYPNIEYIIIDGGSTDGSVEIIKKYEKKIEYWVSESDKGQSHALNKGFKLITGDIVGWLNSDDIYLDNAIRDVVKIFNNNSDVDLLYSHCLYIDENNSIIKLRVCHDYNKQYFLKNPSLISQPSAFFKRNLLNKIGYIDENLQYVMDLDFWLRAASLDATFKLADKKIFAAFRLYSHSKSGSLELRSKNDHMIKIFQESKRIYLKYGGKKISYFYIKLLEKRYFRFYLFRQCLYVLSKILYKLGK